MTAGHRMHVERRTSLGQGLGRVRVPDLAVPEKRRLAPPARVSTAQKSTRPSVASTRLPSVPRSAHVSEAGLHGGPCLSFRGGQRLSTRTQTPWAVGTRRQGPCSPALVQRESRKQAHRWMK
eukprot:3199220-Rhodomonas_salina.1